MSTLGELEEGGNNMITFKMLQEQGRIIETTDDGNSLLTSEKYRTCPICGGEVQAFFDPEFDPDRPFSLGCVCGVSFMTFSTENEMLSSWNHRVDDK